MSNYERKILKNGKDIGLRENNRGAIFIKPKLYFANSKVKAIIKKLSESNIAENQPDISSSEKVVLTN